MTERGNFSKIVRDLETVRHAGEYSKFLGLLRGLVSRRNDTAEISRHGLIQLLNFAPSRGAIPAPLCAILINPFEDTRNSN